MMTSGDPGVVFTISIVFNIVKSSIDLRSCIALTFYSSGLPELVFHTRLGVAFGQSSHSMMDSLTLYHLGVCVR